MTLAGMAQLAWSKTAHRRAAATTRIAEIHRFSGKCSEILDHPAAGLVVLPDTRVPTRQRRHLTTDLSRVFV